MRTRSKSLYDMLQNNKFHREYFDSFTFPGGYPIYYVTDDGAVICPKCANDNNELCLGENENADVNDRNCYDPQWHICDYEINEENKNLYCDHCNELIESAYGD